MKQFEKILLDIGVDKIQNFNISVLTKIFLKNSIVSYIVGIVVIFLVLKLLKLPLKIIKKIVVNSIFAYAILYVLMMFKIVIVPFTYLSYFLVGSFGILGIILSYIFYV